jgi:hypothetical protein
LYWLKNDCENAVDDSIDAAIKHKENALRFILHLPSAPIGAMHNRNAAINVGIKVANAARRKNRQMIDSLA